MSVFDWLDAAPDWAAVVVVIAIYVGFGMVVTLLDEWERRRR